MCIDRFCQIQLRVSIKVIITYADQLELLMFLFLVCSFISACNVPREQLSHKIYLYGRTLAGKNVDPVRRTNS